MQYTRKNEKKKHRIVLIPFGSSQKSINLFNYMKYREDNQMWSLMKNISTTRKTQLSIHDQPAV